MIEFNEKITKAQNCLYANIILLESIGAIVQE